MDKHIRPCPNCGQEITYKDAGYLRRGKKNNSCCKECALDKTRKKTQSVEYREEKSKSTKRLWKDPDSVFNSIDYRDNLSKAQKIRHQNMTSKERQKINQLLRQTWVQNYETRYAKIVEVNQRLDVRKKRSEGVKRAYMEHPERWANAHILAAERMKDPEFKRRCTEKMIAAAQQTSGTSKQELSLVPTMLEFGFEHKVKLDNRWWVDFYNKTLDIVLEYFGDWWHCHQRFHKIIEEKYNGYHPNKKMTIKEILNADNMRLNELKAKHKKVIVIWESEVKAGQLFEKIKAVIE